MVGSIIVLVMDDNPNLEEINDDGSNDDGDGRNRWCGLLTIGGLWWIWPVCGLIASLVAGCGLRRRRRRHGWLRLVACISPDNNSL